MVTAYKLKMLSIVVFVFIKYVSNSSHNMPLTATMSMDYIFVKHFDFAAFSDRALAATLKTNSS